MPSKCHCKTPNGFAHKHCEFQDDSYALISPKTKDIFKTKISEYRMFHLGKVSHHASQIVFGRSLRFETGAPLMREETRSSFNLPRLNVRSIHQRPHRWPFQWLHAVLHSALHPRSLPNLMHHHHLRYHVEAPAPLVLIPWQR